MSVGVASMWPCCDGTVLYAIAIVTILLGDMSRADHLVKKCHPNYYNWPTCVDHPDIYGCECGPGFVWNTRMCVALGIDSRLEFSKTLPVRYTLLLGKPFPILSSFTIALWLKVYEPSHRGTVLSYKHNKNFNLFRIMSGPRLTLKVHSEVIETDMVFNSTQWVHLAWTWTSTDGSWEIYLNGASIKRGQSRRIKKMIPSGGELVLGQSSRTPELHNYFDTDYSFLGEMGFVNIWKDDMNSSQIEEIYRDCVFMQCGDGIEWADFRSGTRGAMRIRWPSLIMEHHLSVFDLGDKPCFNNDEASLSCDRYCSHIIGAQCREEIRENVQWVRTAADGTASVPCPGSIYKDDEPMAYANRSCDRSRDNEGVWGTPIITDCTSDLELETKNTLQDLVGKETVNAVEVMDMAVDLLNHTAEEYFNNPIDLATVIDNVELLVRAQGKTLEHISNDQGILRYSQSTAKFPAFSETSKFANVIASILDNLLYPKNDVAWLTSKPPGGEGDEMQQVIDDLMSLTAQCLYFHMRRGDVTREEAIIRVLKGHLAFKIQIYKTSDLPEMFEFPSAEDLTEFELEGLDDVEGFLEMPKETILYANHTLLPPYISVSLGRFAMPKEVLPNHDLKTKSKEDRVNSALFYVMMTLEDVNSGNFSPPIQIQFPYLDNFNISNPACVHLVHNNLSEPWSWEEGVCSLQKNTSNYAICECSKPGVFAVTTDMYNVDWDRGDKPLILMDYPSYAGCALTALLCLSSCFLLIYFRTSSKTAAIHKNFALSVTLGQILFSLGIDKIGNPTVCHAFAISIHYSFLATFSWLMNEAFNLYIVITYAAHSHGEDTEGGSQWRYYILGWILPGILVGAFVGAHTEDYYAPDMCWIAWQYIWLFTGPAVGIISITVLVLIFTAKEHTESSYTKNEATNKVIQIHSNAIWTQVILLTVSWFFAFLSLKMSGIIVKCLYALFDVLQGAFFFVFYFLLNEEVRKVYKSTRKRKALNKHGYEYSPTQSDDSSHESGNEMIERDPNPKPGPSDASNSNSSGKSKRSKNGQKKKRKNKSQIEASSDDDDDSDCEIMITSV